MIDIQVANYVGETISFLILVGGVTPCLQTSLQIS